LEVALIRRETKKMRRGGRRRGERGDEGDEEDEGENFNKYYLLPPASCPLPYT
jgi:hypothetical protein